MNHTSIWVSLYLGTGILWAAWNANSGCTRRIMGSATGASWAAFFFGMVLSALLWPLWAAISLWILVEARSRRWKGGDLP